jgi:enoyl-CoA hydratase/carnithine racemase
MTSDIGFTQERHVGLITLQREKALNALTLPMIIALQKQLMAWQSDPSIHAVIVQAAPGKAFCAGGDVRWLYDQGREDNHQVMQFFWHEYRLNHFIHHFEKPYISLMNGITMGGGVGISLHGSHPVATENFVFSMPETGIGFFPDIGSSYLLSRCPGFVGEYLALTGGRLGPEEALSWTLINRYIASDKLKTMVTRLIDEDLSEDAHARVDACLEEAALPTNASSIKQQQMNIDASFNGHDVETILSHLSTGPDAWHREMYQCLLQKSPLSLKITLAQIQRARTMGMDDCIKMDYCLVGHFMQGHDFFEGVRALLVDKDKMPHWQIKGISDVSNKEVASYFECGQPELPLFL